MPLDFPFWVKAEYGTAGRSTRKVHNEAEYRQALCDFPWQPDNRLMLQANVDGQYGQVLAVFSRGKLCAVHTSVQTGVGAGNSAAARLSVDFPKTREQVRSIGEALAWHGPITLDFLHINGQPMFIECNPRMIEPANA